MFTPQNMSHVTCHVSNVMCHVSHVTCHVSHVTFFFFFCGQSGEAYWWRVYYQRGLPRLFFASFRRWFIIFQTLELFVSFRDFRDGLKTRWGRPR